MFRPSENIFDADRKLCRRTLPQHTLNEYLREISITLNASFNQVEQLKAVSTYDGAEIFEEISEKGA